MLVSNVSLGPLLAKKYVKAVEQVKLHEDKLRLVNDGLPTMLERSWTAMIKTWENDRSAPNPYYTPVTSTQVYISIVVSLTFGCRSLQNRDQIAPYTRRGGGANAIGENWS